MKKEEEEPAPTAGTTSVYEIVTTNIVLLKQLQPSNVKNFNENRQKFQKG